MTLKIMAIIFELCALALLIFTVFKEKKKQFAHETQIFIREIIILFFWASIMCLSILSIGR